MAHLSDELRTALERFNRQVSASERFLSQQPGTAEASAMLECRDNIAEGSRLVFGEEQDDNGYHLRILNKNKEGDQVIFLGSLPMSQRVEVCRSLPELIKSAKSESQQFQLAVVNEVADLIQQALKDHSV